MYITVAAFVLFTVNANAQNLYGATLHFTHQWKSEPLVLDHPYPIAADSITISQLKYYISNIEFFEGETIVWAEPNSYHLIDCSKDNSTQIRLIIPDKLKFSKIGFLLGVDSLTQSGGVKGADLDPTKGMYWTWQSGYIHFKMEGSCQTCKTADKAFHYHIGGYSHPYNTIRRHNLNTERGKNIELRMDVSKILSEPFSEETYRLMSPSAKAVEMGKIIRFSITD